MTKSKSFFVAGLFVGMFITAVIGAFIIKPKTDGRSDRIVIKLAHGLEESHPVHQGMLFMRKRLEELTGGRATLDVYSGGVMGKMIDAQSIVVAATATRWFNHEGDILRYVFFHSVALAVLVGGLVTLMAYVYPFTKLVY